jgi:predicted Fe-S protein YdhL (DUF1289 family)
MYISPCISTCKINKDTRTCNGCGRTIDQISQWVKYTDEQRMNIMKELGYGKRTSNEDRLARNANVRSRKKNRRT